MRLEFAIIGAVVATVASFVALAFATKPHHPSVAATLTCADVDRIVPGIAASNGTSLGVITCTRIDRIGPSRWQAKAMITEAGEVRYWTFSLIYDPYLIFDAKQTGSATVPSG